MHSPASHPPAPSLSDLYPTDDDARFRVDAPNEIAAILEELCRESALAVAYLDEGPEFQLTSILGVGRDRREVLLDYGRNEELNRRLLQRQRTLLVTRHRGVRVQFNASAIVRVELHDGPALRIPMPESLLRMQRRDHFRLSLPNRAPLFCRVRGLNEPLRLVDISLGGLGFIDERGRGQWEPGTILPGFNVRLTGFGEVSGDLEVRSCLQLPGGARRVGCRLLQLDPGADRLIQRYIQSAQLERRRATLLAEPFPLATRRAAMAAHDRLARAREQ